VQPVVNTFSEGVNEATVKELYAEMAEAGAKR
jgi:hypothetical protein